MGFYMAIKHVWSVKNDVQQGINKYMNTTHSIAIDSTTTFIVFRQLGEIYFPKGKGTNKQI